MEQIIQRCGRFVLVQTYEGFAWRLITRAGRHWHWDPAAAQWLSCCRWNATADAATAGLHWTLRQEQAGHLNEQHRYLAPDRGEHVPGVLYTSRGQE